MHCLAEMSLIMLQEADIRDSLDAHQELGIPVDKNLIFMNADNQLVISDAVSKLYEAGADGIVCMDDVICSMCHEQFKGKEDTGSDADEGGKYV